MGPAGVVQRRCWNRPLPGRVSTEFSLQEVMWQVLRKGGIGEGSASGASCKGAPQAGWIWKGRARQGRAELLTVRVRPISVAFQWLHVVFLSQKSECLMYTCSLNPGPVYHPELAGPAPRHSQGHGDGTGRMQVSPASE